MDFGLDAAGGELCMKNKDGTVHCGAKMSVATYREFLRSLPHTPAGPQSEGAAVYITLVLAFYVVLLLVLIGGTYKRKNKGSPPPAGRRHLLTIKRALGVAQPTLIEHHPNLKPGAIEV